MLCDAMRWNHLPQAGGLYDQHPDIIDRFYYLFAERAKEEARIRKREERNAPGGGQRRRVAGSRGRA